jgi:acyl-CoA dehydrogenase
MSTATARETTFLGDVRRIAAEVAASHAEDVDDRARFPAEAIDALRGARALSAAVGEDAVGLPALAEACSLLARACSSSAMIFAMHQIQVLTVARHADPGSLLGDWLRDAPAAQRLVASITSEAGTGGDMGRSIAAVTRGDDGGCSFRKEAPTISYGAYADDYLTTLRRGPDAQPNDQVLALTSREQTALEPAGRWDALGMRGTCSPGFVARADFPAGQVLDVPFAQVCAESMVPISHVLWSHVWLGIAAEAFDRARRYERAAARGPAGSTRAAESLSGVAARLTQLRATVAWGLEDFQACDGPDRERLATVGAAVRFNNLKIAASEQAAAVCQAALRVCGMQGYRNDTPYSVGRQLRDALSAALMVSNDRIHAADAGMLLIAKDV